MNGKEYRLALKRWADGLDEHLDTLARSVTQEIAHNVVNDTPVDTGFLRGSWQPSLNQRPDGQGNGAGAHAITAVVSGMKAGDIFYMSNNAAYAMRIEHGFVGTDSMGRTYDQAGRFFVRRNIRRGRAIAKRHIAQLSKALTS